MNILKKISFVSTVILLTSCSLNEQKGPKPDATPVMSQNNLSTGGVDGGGGKSIVCRDNSNNIISAELLDLYEGRTMYHLSIVKSSDPVDKQIDLALKVIPDNSAISAFVSVVKEKMIFLPPNTELKDVNDSFDIVFPSGCKAEQLAHYYSDEKILVNSDIWKHLTETDQAALILHEAIYRVNRSLGATDSRQSRHAVMNLFSLETKWTNPNEGIPTDALNCVSTQGGLFVAIYPASNQDWYLQFKVLGRSLVFSKKRVQAFNFENILDFNEAKTFPVFENSGKSIQLPLFVRSNFEDNDIITIEKSWESIGNYKTPRYYISWKSGTFPDLSIKKQLLNCSMTFPK